MIRKVLVMALLVALPLAVFSLAVFSLPAAARTVERAPEAPNYARIAPAGGILSHAKLNLAPTGAGEATESPWTSIAAMPVGTDGAGGGAFILGSKSVYVPGGYTAAGTLHDRMQVYNALSNTWVNEAEVMANGIGWADSAVCVNPATNVVHVVNGVDGEFLYASHQVYTATNPVGSRWGGLSYPELPTGEIYYSQGSGCAFLGGKMYLFGGYAVVDPNPIEITDATWEYDPATDTWADTGKSMITGRFWGAYANSSTAAYAVGGTADIFTFDGEETNERFTVAGGWTAITSMAAGQGRVGNGLSVLGANLVQYGGATGNLSIGFTLQAETLVCGSGGGCASWVSAPVPGGKQLGTPRWFGAWAGAGATPLIGVYAGGAGSTGTVATSEKLP